jgi:hypothetical protein
MWGTSSPDDKLTVVLGNLIEATKIAGPQSDRLMARKLSPGNFGLLQQYLPTAVIRSPLNWLHSLCLDDANSWMWTLAFGYHEDRTPTHGYAATREAAMTAFAKSWRRE